MTDGGFKKMPDLLFRPVHVGPRVTNLSDWGFWMEAKIINGKSKPVGLYVTKGIARFVSGEYAPRMPCSGMVAYVRDRSFPGKALAGYPSVTLELGDAPDTGRSIHARSPPMVAIELIHLWLDAS